MDEAVSALPPTVPPPRRRRRALLALRAIAWLAAMAVVALAAAWYALGTQAALDYVLQRAVASAEGRLTIEGGEGSLLSTVRIARIAWRGDTLDVEARDTALVWSPFDLVSRRFIVQGLGAKRLTFAFKETKDAPGGLPASLALPLEVEVRNIGVERIEWRGGGNSGAATGVAFAYAGGAQRHTVRALRFVTDYGTLTGDAQLGASAPFALAGRLAFAGDATYRGGRADLEMTGTLDRIAVAADGELRKAAVSAKALVTPFAPALLVAAELDARDVDLAQFGDALPATALALKVAARPEGSGFAGAVDATNAAAGALDAGRIPVTSLAAKFAWDGAVLALTGLEAGIAGGGRATGDLTLPLRDGAVSVNLTLAGIDLARIQSTLIATRLAGSVTGEMSQQRQILRGDVRDAASGVALNFAGSVQDRRVTLERLQARAGTGEISGTGSIALDGARAFTVTARASHFDPSRVVASMPSGVLDGTVTAQGTLAPAWDVTAAFELAPGSRFADTPVSGTARARLSRTMAKDVAIDARIASASIKLTGAFGTPGDTLAYALDAPRLADLKPLLVRHAGVAVPDPFSGALRARGTVTGDPRSPGFTVDAHGEALHWGPRIGAVKLDIAATAAPGVNAAGPVAIDARSVTFKVGGTGVTTPVATFASLNAGVTGTLAQHKGSMAAKADDIDFESAFSGGVRTGKRPDGTQETAWVGAVDTLANRGAFPFKLDAPAPLEIARDRIRVGATRIAVAEGRADLAYLALYEGRIATQGSFTGIPFTALARMSGTKLPFPSTLALGGDWSLAAAPRLNGTVSVRRERGDWFATESATLGPADLALGISEFALSAAFAEDALTATGRFRSARAGTADASATLAPGSEPGRPSTTAAMTATLTAELASLRPLQPWIGTAAVMDGRAHVEVTARGTLAQPLLAGTVAGDALRFDLPQYGVHLKDGTLRARLVDRSLVLDDFSFAGGAGRFTAKGTIARPADSADGRSGSSVEWQAQDFTVVNQPNLRIVADGKGTLALVDGRLMVAGDIAIDEGRVVYVPTSAGRLSDDVVIVGQPRRAANAAPRELPLALDVEVTLGRNFTFSGEGLDTRLAGRVRVTTTPAGTLAARGTIRAVAGTYFVFGQRLDIERGRLIFDGPAGNPALDIVALRKNLAVEAGVEVSGTVRVPRVRLVSNPPVPDGEKLSWLLTGQGLDRANRADLSALSAASASLLGQGRKPITTQIANSLGLDDISVRESASSVTGGTSGQVVAFGKRISDRLTLVYEQGLTLANNALRIEYALSRTLTLRAEAGVVGSVGLYYRRSYD